MTNQTLVQLLQIITYCISILGIPGAIYVYWDNKRKERKDKEYNTYHALDEKYSKFLELCIQYPELNMYYLPLEKSSKLTPTQKIQRYALFEILISTLERSHIMYADQSTYIKKLQWGGWKQQIDLYCARADFRELWRMLPPEFYDVRFMKYIDGVIEALER